jgi:FkbM family methyltransferase
MIRGGVSRPQAPSIMGNKKEAGRKKSYPFRSKLDASRIIIAASLIIMAVLYGAPALELSSILTVAVQQKKAQQETTSCNQILPTRKAPPKFFSHVECKNTAMQIPKEGFIFATNYFQYRDEKKVAKVFHDVLSSKSPEELQRDVVLDIGGNTGWFTALAAFCYGATVHVFEPQTGCLETMCSLLDENQLTSTVHIHNNPVAATPFVLKLPRGQGCDPGFSPNEINKEHFVPANDKNAGMIQIQSINPVDIVTADQKVHLAKIDVEGNEISALQALEPLLKSGQLSDIVMELAPKRWLLNTENWTREF